MRVAVSGSTGLIGGALVRALRSAGDDVVRLVRHQPQAADERQWDPAAALDPGHLDGVDAVVHLAGAGVGDHRWTKRWKQEIRDSRVRGTTSVVQAVDAAGVPTLLAGSAVGIYGDTGDRLADESTPPGDGFLAAVCRDWEAAAAQASQARVVQLRTGIVLDRDRGALPKQIRLSRLGVLAPLGSGKQWVSWISLADEVAAIQHLLRSTISGPVNLVAPAPVRNADFTRALNRAMHRPTPPVPVPAPVLRAVLGEFAHDVLTGQRVRPAALSTDGFSFRHADVATALGSVLGR